AERRFAEATADGLATDYAVVILGANGVRKRVRGTTQAISNDGRFAGMFGVVVSAQDDSWPAPRPDLTARQLEVLGLLAAGRSTPEIAAQLGVAVETARNHIRRLLRNVDAH